MSFCSLSFLLTEKVNAKVIFCAQDFDFSILKSIEKLYFSNLKDFIKEQKFEGKIGQSLTIVGFDGQQTVNVFLIGIGKKEKSSIELIRRSVAKAVRMAECKKSETLSLEFDYDFFSKDLSFVFQIATTSFLMACYRFQDFVTNLTAKTFLVKKLIFIIKEDQKEIAQKGIETGTIIADSVNRARHWVDMPANLMTTKKLMEHAVEVAAENNLQITVFDENKIEELSMGGLKAVGMASKFDPYLVILEYKSKKENAKTIAIVGKGIVFDSGGLNIKPTGSMETMKEDMSGAAAVINAISAISKLNPDVNVVALAAIAENMISGLANHPGDIITFYNGKTAVIGNTDAEGRLVLADALAYAHKNFKLDAMIDVATLTGAVAHAVGPFFNGLLSEHEDLVSKIENAAKTSGDHVWRLPLNDDYKVMVKSDIADLCNNGNRKYKAGPTNGACFLQHFVGDTPWAHIDMGATAFDVPDLQYFRGGATGAGTRLLIDLIMQWK